MIPRKIELLAPGGDIDAIKAAVVAGADAIYCGLHKFNARNPATNITVDDLAGVIRLAHDHDCKVYLTLNIIFADTDLPELIRLLNRLAHTKLDGIIAQDLGLLHLLAQHFDRFAVHASTQLTTHNAGQLQFLRGLGVTRVNLSRELSIDEIRALTHTAHGLDMATEVFVHGSYCISFSGLCYLSSVQSANSGNRGRCSQPCRDRYRTTPAGREFPLNLKDNSAFDDLQRLSDAGVDAVKIEGRVKKFPYVYTVTEAWSRLLQSHYDQDGQPPDGSDLLRVFNRDFSNGYLRGVIHRDMFSDHPRNRSAHQLSAREDASLRAGTAPATDRSFEEIAQHRARIRGLIEEVSVDRAPLTVRISGRLGTPLTISVQTPESCFEVCSTELLTPLHDTAESAHLTPRMFRERLRAIDHTEYALESLKLDHLDEGLFLPFREITALKKRILQTLRHTDTTFEPVQIPAPATPRRDESARGLAVLISSTGDLSLGDATSAELYFQLPSRMGRDGPALREIFRAHDTLIPWFPPVLLGQDYDDAVDFLRQLQPRRLVTNNTGLAHEAARAGLAWVAGPYLNLANSHSLACLKQRYDCRGAFVSNELSRDQLRRIKAPEDFALYYRIYHPSVLLTSRQCLFQQVTGCEKTAMDEDCLGDCERSATLENLKDETLYIHKTRGSFASLYHRAHFLNTAIIDDPPNHFSRLLVDLRDVQTDTRVPTDKAAFMGLFEACLAGAPGATDALRARVHPTFSRPYQKGF